MAKSDLELNIRTKYSGEGLKKLDNAVRNTSQKLKSVSGSVGGITRALDSLGGAAGGASKAAGALTGILGGFAQGGFIGIGIAAVTQGINAIGEAVERAKERARELAVSVKDGLVAAADAAKKRFDMLKESISRAMTVAGQKNQISDVKNDIRTQNELDSISQRGRDERAGMTKSYDKAYSKAKEQHDSAVATGRRQMEQAADNEYRLADVTASKKKTLQEAQKRQQEARDLANQSTDQIAEQIKQQGLKRLREQYGPGLAFTRAANNYIENGVYNQQAVVAKKMYKERASAADEEVKKADREYNDAVNAEAKAHQLTVLQEKKYIESVKKADEALKEAAEARKQAAEAEKKAAEDKAKAEAEQAKKRAEADQKAADQKKKQEDAQAAAEKKAADRKNANKEVKDARSQLEAQLESADNRLKERRDAARQWEQEAQGARGVKFNDWMKTQRENDKAKKKSDKQLANADREIAALEGRVLAKDGTIRRGASKADIARLEKLKQWREFQDPNNNQAQKDAEKIEKEKIQLQKDTKSKIEAILTKLDDVAL